MTAEENKTKLKILYETGLEVSMKNKINFFFGSGEAL